MDDTPKPTRRAGIRPLCPIHLEGMSGSADETLEFYSCGRRGCDLHWRSASGYFQLTQGLLSKLDLEQVLCNQVGHGHTFIARRNGNKAVRECSVKGCSEAEEKPLSSKSESGLPKEQSRSAVAEVPSESPRATWDGGARNDIPATRKRPGWVWIICIWYAIVFVVAALSMYLLFSGIFPMTPKLKAYVESLTAFDYFLNIVQPLLAISAAVTLFLLRKQATYLFWSALAVGIAAHVWQYDLRSGIAGAHSIPAASTGAYIAMGAHFAVCVYVQDLKKRGTLR